MIRACAAAMMVLMPLRVGDMLVLVCCSAGGAATMVLCRPAVGDVGFLLCYSAGCGSVGGSVARCALRNEREFGKYCVIGNITHASLKV